MVLARRSFLFALVTGLALFATGCSSNNKDKIVGKWEAAGGILTFEFTADGQFIASGAMSIKGKYSLGAGDNVTLSDLNPPLDGKSKSKEKITINGDSMTIAGSSDGKSMTFTRKK
ncbi:unnamed protein product [Gemmata massiliana]|uniref:Lipocalin-like domain-containing protein n=1 Tax=Gemmata massiliana TaxID=1210884 RepID=A0A6P2D6M5_9BACT|nr:hypothetical protein [Gemmata massiliana]VTR96799.1 unnamed protein product [Gemmata massiliana]